MRDDGKLPKELDMPVDRHGYAEQRKPEVLGVMPLREIKDRSERGHEEEQKTQHQFGDDRAVPALRDGDGEPVGNVVMRPQLNSVEQSMRNLNPWSSPGADSNKHG